MDTREGRVGPGCRRSETKMLGWVILFLIIAIIAAIFGFGGIAAGAMLAAKIIFWIFVALFVIGLLVSLAGGPTWGGWWGPRRV